MVYRELLPYCKTNHQKAIINHLINHSGDKNSTCEHFGLFRTNLNRILRDLTDKLEEAASINEGNADIVVIADTQVDLVSPTSHLYSLSKYIWEHKPSHIVHIGDHWDFPSLSSYASRLHAEGKRLTDDLAGGFDAFKLIMAHVTKMNKREGEDYRPKKHFLMGNHEMRLERFINDHPVLQGCFDLEDFVRSEGWNFHKMNEPVWIHDICFSHYMENPMSGRPVGGSMENKLNKFPHSFVHGHQQQYQYARRQNLKGKPHFGVCAGSFYMHDEDYRGANNTEIRGFTHLKGFNNRYGHLDHDVEFVSLERLLENYS